MNDATLNGGTFPFMESVATVAVDEATKGVGALKRVLAQYEAATATHGAIVPLTTVAEHLEVTVQRVQNLIDLGRLDTVEIGGRRWVIGKSAIAYVAEGPRKAGRPRKLSKVGNSIRLGQELAASVESQLTK